MTDLDALREAQRRWGDHAVARSRRPRTTTADGRRVPTHMVGTESGVTLVVKGRGLDWHEAFADADSRSS